MIGFYGNPVSPKGGAGLIPVLNIISFVKAIVKSAITILIDRFHKVNEPKKHTKSDLFMRKKHV